MQAKIELTENDDPLTVYASPDGTLLSVGGIGPKGDVVRVLEI